MNEKDVLRSISKKLDRIVALTQIGLRKELDILKEEIKKDKVSQKVLEFSDGTLAAGDLQEKVAKSTGVSEITVKRRISELLDKGLLLSNRDGQNVFYVNSGIVEV